MGDWTEEVPQYEYCPVTGERCGCYEGWEYCKEIEEEENNE